MASILCLAHYCDTHGPTPLMVTEGLTVDCSSCDSDPFSRRPSTSRSRRPSIDFSALARASSRNSSSSSKENPSDAQRPQSTRSPNGPVSPPGSPRVQALQSSTGNPNRRDSNFKKTYDDNDRKREFTACENCALTLPKKTREEKEGAKGKVDASRPILRTRKPFERVAHEVLVDEPSPPKSLTSSDEETANAKPRRHSRTSSRNLNTYTSRSHSHTHYLDYTSTHEPLQPSSFSIIRQSCLRTLSCETLPPSGAPSPSTPSSPNLSGPATSFSGGPIFFGDPLAGYTTAFIFRIRDPSARGRSRVYALMATSEHGQWASVQAFSFLSLAFRELATWIQRLAEEELEKVESPGGGNKGSVNSTPTSSFLSGRNRMYEGRLMQSARSQAKGLAELVGMPDFFIELHTRFVRLLIELGLVMGS